MVKKQFLVGFFIQTNQSMSIEIYFGENLPLMTSPWAFILLHRVINDNQLLKIGACSSISSFFHINKWIQIMKRITRSSNCRNTIKRHNGTSSNCPPQLAIYFMTVAAQYKGLHSLEMSQTLNSASEKALTTHRGHQPNPTTMTSCRDKNADYLGPKHVVVKGCDPTKYRKGRSYCILVNSSLF